MNKYAQTSLLLPIMLFLLLTLPCLAHAEGEIVVGREVARYVGAPTDVTQLTLVLSVFNLTDRRIEDVLLQDTFEEGVTVIRSNPPASRVGGAYVWALGALPAQVVRDVTVELALTGITIGDTLDAGAHAVGVYYLTPVRDSAVPAVLLDRSSYKAELEGTLDANARDMYVRRLAARLDYDAGVLESFVRDNVKFEAYDGSLRGARGTLWSMAGNAMDQSSLLVALLRASGVPARYAGGVISATDARRLIQSMFPARSGISGIVPDNMPLSEPLNDADLIAETTPHTRVEYYNSGQWTATDPSFADNPPDIASATSYVEVPDARRHKIRFRLTAESAGSSIFTPLVIVQPMDITLPVVQTVGEPITIGHAAKRTFTSFLGLFQVIQEYRPYVAVGVNAVTGETIKEEWGNSFLILTQNIITAEWLDVAIEDPSGATQSFRRTLFDKLGIVRRANGEEPTFAEFNTNPTQPTISELDFVTIYAPVSRTDPSILVRLKSQMDEHEKRFNQILPQVQGINLTNPTPAQLPLLKELSALMSEIPIFTTRIIGASWLTRADPSGERVATGFNVVAYESSPNIILVNSQAQGADILYRLDLRRVSERVIPDPGQTAFADFLYRSTKGRLDAAMEHSVASAFSASSTQPIVSFFDILDAAAQQNIPLIVVEEGNKDRVEDLAISDEAKMRVTAALNAGKVVEIPASAPIIDGSPAIGWWEMDAATGEIYSVMEDGGHQAIIHYIAVINGTALNHYVAAGIGVIAGFFQQFYIFTGGLLSGLIEHQDLGKAAAEAKREVSIHVARSCAGIIGGAAGSAGGTLGSIIADSLIGELPGQTSFNEYLRLAMAAVIRNIILEVTGLRETFSAGLCFGGLGAVNWIKDNFGGDPEVAPYRINTHIFDPAPAAVASSTSTVQSATAPAALTGGVSSELTRLSGGLTLEFAPQEAMAFRIDALASSNWTVRTATGAVVASGAIDLKDLQLPAVLEAAGSLTLSGTGSLSAFPRYLEGLAVGSDWEACTATTTGGALLVFLGEPMLNNNPLPFGEYEFAADDASFQFSGGCFISPVTETLNITATKSIFGVGAGSGSFQDGALMAAVDEGISFANYNGSIALASLDSASDIITASGTVSQFLRLAASPKSTNAANDGVFSCTLTARGKAGEVVNLKAHAPDGWGALFTASSAVALSPPPIISTGTHTARFYAESTQIPGLVGQSRATLGVQSISSGIDLSVRHQPDRYIIQNDAWIYGVFEITVKGRSNDTLDLHLTQTGAPEGNVSFASEHLTLTGTSKERNYLYMAPGDPLPASGTIFNIEVKAEDAGAGIMDVTTIQYVMPPVPGASVTVEHPIFYTTQAHQLTTQLRIRNTGNRVEDILLDFATPAGFTADFDQPGVLVPGQTHSQTLTLNSDTAVPEANAVTIVRVMSGGQELNRFGIAVVLLDSQAAIAAFNAAETALIKSRFTLAVSLNSLAEALLELESDFQSLAARDLVIQHLNSVRSSLPPQLQPFDARLGGIGTSMAGHTGAELVPDLANLALALNDLNTALTGAPDIAGDLDIDGLVNWRDLFILQNTWMRQPPDPAKSDLVPDGIIDTKDLLEFIELSGNNSQ